MSLREPLMPQSQHGFHLLADLASSSGHDSIITQSLLASYTTTVSRKRKEMTPCRDFFCEGAKNSTTTSSRKRPRTVLAATGSVRFRPESDGLVTFVTPRYVAKEDMPDVWYSRQDYRMFRQESRTLVMAFEMGLLGHIDAEDCCLRGLEANLHPSIMETRRTARTNAINVVLQTQVAQKEHNIRDPEMIRGLSAMLSKDACEDALKLASYDQEEAVEAMQDNVQV